MLFRSCKNACLHHLVPLFSFKVWKVIVCAWCVWFIAFSNTWHIKLLGSTASTYSNSSSIREEDEKNVSTCINFAWSLNTNTSSIHVIQLPVGQYFKNSFMRPFIRSPIKIKDVSDSQNVMNNLTFFHFNHTSSSCKLDAFHTYATCPIPLFPWKQNFPLYMYQLKTHKCYFLRYSEIILLNL